MFVRCFKDDEYKLKVVVLSLFFYLFFIVFKEIEIIIYINTYKKFYGY